MNTAFQKYAAALLPLFIIVIGASQTVLKGVFDLPTAIPFGVLVLGAIVTYAVPLIPSGWQGGFKTGTAIVTAILTAVLPFALPGGFVFSAAAPIIVVAILNALATQLGVNIRVDNTPVNTNEASTPSSVG